MNLNKTKRREQVEREDYENWLNTLNDKERILYKFIMKSLQEEPEKWVGTHFTTSTMYSSSHSLYISRYCIKEVGIVSKEMKVLLDIRDDYHALLMEKIYSSWLDKSLKDDNNKRISDIDMKLKSLGIT
jgi:pyruvate-formate lyase